MGVCWDNGVVYWGIRKQLSSEAIMSDLVVVGDYELLEKKREGYTSN